jgi:hypothetical protein
MRRLFTPLIACLVFCAGTAHAQPGDISLTAFPKVGQVLEVDLSDSASASQIPLGSPGANQSWNFSPHAPSGTVLRRHYRDVAGAPNANRFPNATFVIYDTTEVPLFNTTLFTFVFEELNNGIVRGLGNTTYLTSDFGPDSSLEMCSPPEIRIAELSFGDSIGEDYMCVDSSYGDAPVDFDTTMGRQVIHYDAHGSLTLPGGVRPNVARQAVYDYELLPDTTADTTYTFIDLDTGLPVAYATATGGRGIMTVTGNVSRGAAAPQALFSMYPNPADERVRLRGDFAGSDIRVITMDGRVVRRAEWPSGSSSAEVNTADLAGGTYLVVVGEHLAQRLVIRR